MNPQPLNRRSKGMNAQHKKYQAEDDVRILANAEEVKKAHAKDPARKKACQECAKQKMEGMQGMMKMVE